MDDLLVMGPNISLIFTIKDSLHHAFNIKDISRVKYYLGLEAARYTNGKFISQRKYITDLLDDARLSDCKPTATPLSLGCKLSLMIQT